MSTPIKQFLPLLVLFFILSINLCQYIDSSEIGALCRVETQRKDCGDNLACIENKCTHCVTSKDCSLGNPFSILECKKTNHQGADKHFCLRGDLLAPSTQIWDVMAVILNLIGGAISSAGGAGGGGLFVPILMVFGQFATSAAAPISIAMITGAAFFNFIVHSFRKHPFLDKPMIDYDATVIMEPLQLLGTSLGVILVNVFPDWLLTLCLIIVLSFATWRTFINAVQTYRAETKAKMMSEPAALGDENSLEGESAESSSTSLMPQAEYKSIADEDPFEKDDKVREREEQKSKEEQDPTLSTSADADAKKKSTKIRSYEDNEEGPQQYVDEEEEQIELQENPIKAEEEPKEMNEDGESNEFQQLVDENNKKKEVNVQSSKKPAKASTHVNTYIDTEEMLPQPTKSKTKKEVEEEELVFQKATSTSGPVNPELRMILMEDSSIFPLAKIGIILLIWVLVALSGFVRGGFHGSVSPIGAQTCSLFWWTLYLLNYPLIITIAVVVVALVYNRYQRKLQLGYCARDGEIKWTPTSALGLPVICFFIGVLCSALGIGGGMFTSPLFFELAANNEVASATSSVMVLLTSSVAAIQYMFSGSLPIDYGILYFTLGFIAAIFGELLIGYPAHRHKRTYLLVWSVAIVCSCALLFMGTTGIYRAIIDLVDRAYMGFKNFC